MEAFKRMVLIGALLAITCACRGENADTEKPEHPRRTRAAICRLDSRLVKEPSGIAASRKHPGVFWVHGDSGGGSTIYAFNADGETLAEVAIADAPNIDWEDICADDDGFLYIGDIGDGGGYWVRYVYKIKEPDPFESPTEPVRWVHRYAFGYPGNHRFDAESLFVYQGQLYILAKTRLPGAALYRVDASEGETSTLKRVATLPVALATAADVSPNGKLLAIGSYPGTWVFPLTDSDSFVDVGAVKVVNYESGNRIEGCCFDGNDLVVVGETSGRVFRITADDIAAEAYLTWK